MRRITAFLSLMFLGSAANAGLFNDFVNKAKQSAGQVIDESVNKVMGNAQEEDNQENSVQESGVTQNSKSVEQTYDGTPHYDYDTALVKPIQQQLKDQGYLVGAVDGLYGNGTRKAIQAYQQDHGLDADGVPSQTLLDRLQSTVGKKATAKHSADNEWPEPTMASLTLAAIHFRPDALDKESTLRSVLYQIHPETNPIMSNEFKWHKQKAQLKQQLLEEAKAAQLQFEVKPWNKNSISASRTLELKKYDFGKSAFRVSFATGGMGGGILPAMLIPAQCKLEKQYPQNIESLSINVDVAEKIDNYFNHNRRILYPSYRIRVVGVDLASSRPLPIVNFDNNRIKLYARENTPAGNKMKTEYKLLTISSIPYDKAILAKASAPKKYNNQKTSNTDVVKRAVIDGVRLGMSMDDAMAALKAEGFDMESPGQPDSLVGIRVRGRKITEDGKGSDKVYFSSMNGKVYEFVKEVMYLSNRLPPGKTPEDLKRYYENKLITPFKQARYSSQQPNGRIVFDDERREPYTTPIMSPHAEVYLGVGSRLSFKVSMTWKGLVGAKW